MSAEYSRASGSSVGQNPTMKSLSFSSCQHGSKSCLRLVPKVVRLLAGKSKTGTALVAPDRLGSQDPRVTAIVPQFAHSELRPGRVVSGTQQAERREKSEA